jgi:hypothetical protein
MGLRMPRHMEHRFRHHRDPIPGMHRHLQPLRRTQRTKHSTNRKRSLNSLPRKETKRSLAGEKEGRRSLSSDPRIGRNGWYHLKSYGPTAGRWILIPILETPVLGRRPPGMHGNEKTQPKDPSPEGPRSREVSFQVRYPNPRKNPSGIFQERYRANDPERKVLRDRSRRIKPPICRNGLPREHHPWDRSPEPSSLGTG